MRKTIKIFSLPSHQTVERTSGVDMVRIIQPMNALNGYEDKNTKFVVDVYDIHSKQPSWLEVAKKYDIIYLNYIGNPWTYAGMGAMARHYKRKIVIDTDDDIHSVQKDNPTYNSYHENDGLALKDLTAIYNDCDYLTTTNTYLKNVLMTRTNKDVNHIKVLPNYIDLDNLYTHRSPFKDDGQIQLVHFGSTTHFLDLDNEAFAKGVDRIFREFPNVTIKMVGANIPKYHMRWGQRYISAWGDTDVYRWVKKKFGPLMDEADIVVVPLATNDYTRSKSNIKFLEASSANKPGVWQRTRQYNQVINEGINGMLASTEHEWYTAIKKLIKDKELRRSMGEEAFKTVKRDWQLKDHIKERAEFFKRVLTNE